MKQIKIILLFCLITMKLQAQCDSISIEILNIVKNETYEKIDNLIMPIEQQRKILHWPKSDETEMMLLTINDSLKFGLIKSVKKLRLELLNKGFDLESTEYNGCELTDNKLEIYISNNELEFSFMVETKKTDKIYLMRPINVLSTKLPTRQSTGDEIKNMLACNKKTSNTNFHKNQYRVSIGFGNIVQEINTKITNQLIFTYSP